MKRSIDAALFDLDDVVVRTDKYHYKAWKRLAEEEGWEVDHETGTLLRGMPRMQCLDLILKRNHIELPDERKAALASRKNTYLVELLCDLGPDDLLPHVIEFLDALKARQLKLGLFSLSQNAGVILERLSLRRLFDAVLTGQDDRCTYYNPDIFLNCAKMLAVKPTRCVVFENIDSAAQFALDCEMQVIGVGIPDLLQTVTESVQDFSAVDIDRLLAHGRVSQDV
ncbi:MAG: HAD hydrolase-like protein [Chitinivibrionales bacterium]|nr:HAD hydrolase-like protein [Chitinivibrionales bacterium]